jgi:hypothetical protein
MSKIRKWDSMNEYSFPKKLIFWFSWNGFRGSHLLWKFVKPNLQRLTVVTPNGFPFFVNDDDWICRTDALDVIFGKKVDSSKVIRI